MSLNNGYVYNVTHAAVVYIWGPKIEVPQKIVWFIREHHTKMDDDWGLPLFEETSIYGLVGPLGQHHDIGVANIYPPVNNHRCGKPTRNVYLSFSGNHDCFQDLFKRLPHGIIQQV